MQFGPHLGALSAELDPSSSEMQSISYSEYGKFLQESKLSTNKQQSEMVKRVGVRIQKAVEQFMAEQKSHTG